jgi:hypothetical protein
MAAAYSKGQPSMAPLSYQAMTAIVRQAQRLADAAVVEVMREARIEVLMRSEGLSQEQADAQWLDEASA